MNNLLPNVQKTKHGHPTIGPLIVALIVITAAIMWLIKDAIILTSDLIAGNDYSTAGGGFSKGGPLIVIVILLIILLLLLAVCIKIISKLSETPDGDSQNPKQ